MRLLLRTGFELELSFNGQARNFVKLNEHENRGDRSPEPALPTANSNLAKDL